MFEMNIECFGVVHIIFKPQMLFSLIPHLKVTYAIKKLFIIIYLFPKWSWDNYAFRLYFLLRLKYFAQQNISYF